MRFLHYRRAAPDQKVWVLVVTRFFVLCSQERFIFALKMPLRFSNANTLGWLLVQGLERGTNFLPIKRVSLSLFTYVQFSCGSMQNIISNYSMVN